MDLDGIPKGVQVLEFCIRRGEIYFDIEQGLVVNEIYLDNNIWDQEGST